MLAVDSATFGNFQPAASRAATGREQKSLRLHTLLQGVVPLAGACRRKASLLGNSVVHEIAYLMHLPRASGAWHRLHSSWRARARYGSLQQGDHSSTS